MEVKFGRAKHLERIKLKDVLKNPIWVSAHDDRHDEEYEKPIVNSDDVTVQIYQLGPIITFKVGGNDNLYGAGYYYRHEEESYLFSIALWIKDCWVTIEDSNSLQLPATFIAIPKIYGKSDVKFICRDINENRAYEIVDNDG